MMPSGFALWWALVCLTALVPGYGVGYLAKTRHWPLKRCRSVALVAALSCFLACLLAAILGFQVFAPGLGPVFAIPVWLGLVSFAPITAQRVANPRTRFEGK
jgi:hypothetical protein